MKACSGFGTQGSNDYAQVLCGVAQTISSYTKKLEGYQIKGTAEYVTSGAVVETFQKMVESMFHGAATAKGALLITPEKVIVTTPGAENKKEL